MNIIRDGKGRFKKGTCGRIPKSINLNLTSNLCYLVGLILGDGHVCKKLPWGINIASKDKDFVYSLEKIFQEINLNPNYHCNKQTKCWYIQSASKLFCEWYYKINNYDSLLDMLKTESQITSFIRGYYEAEGHSHYHIQGKHKRLYLTISNQEIWQLHLIQFLLSKLGIKSNFYGPYDMVTSFGETFMCHLKIRRKKESELFMNMIKPKHKLPK